MEGCGQEMDSGEVYMMDSDLKHKKNEKSIVKRAQQYNRKLS